MEILGNLDLLTVGMAVAGTVVLGYVVFLNNPKSITARSFLIFSLITALWGLANYINYQAIRSEYVLWVIRLVMFFAVFQAFYFCKLVLVFPDDKVILPKYINFLVFPLVIFVATITLTPLVFPSINITSGGLVAQPVVGPGIVLFAVTALSLVSFGIISLLRKYKASRGVSRQSFGLVLTGTGLMFGLIIVFNFWATIVLENTRFIPFSALFTFPFVFFTSYAILKHKLFNVKVAATAVLVFVLSIISLGEIIFARDLQLVIYRGSIFVLILTFGIMLIKGVLKEVSLREELQVANEGQATLIHFINHQIKGYLSKARIIFAELLTEKEYEPISESAKHLLGQGEASLKEGVDFVQKILRASDIERGAFIYEMAPFDIKPVVEESFEELKKRAEEKSLAFELEIGEGDFTLNGDKSQLKEAIKNLLDNSINYTPSGRVKAILKKDSNKIIFAVEDTGVGISEELRPKLFTKGGRDKDSQKINVNSTGYGLSIVKNIVEAHKGRVWVESAGSGKGSTFFLELPTVS